MEHVLGQVSGQQSVWAQVVSPGGLAPRRPLPQMTAEDEELTLREYALIVTGVSSFLLASLPILPSPYITMHIYIYLQ